MQWLFPWTTVMGGWNPGRKTCVYMDARPRQLLIDFLSTEIGCKLRKLRPTQIRRLLDEFCNPPTALPHSPANSPRNCVLVPVSGLFCRILYVKNKHLVTVSSSQAPRSWLLITFCAIWELSLRRVAYCFQGFCSRARKNLCGRLYRWAFRHHCSYRRNRLVSRFHTPPSGMLPMVWLDRGIRLQRSFYRSWFGICSTP